MAEVNDLPNKYMFKVKVIETYGTKATFVVRNVLNDPHR